MFNFLESLLRLNNTKYEVRFCAPVHPLEQTFFEAEGAESKADFRHKLKIAYKEAWETKFWIILCRDSESLPNPDNLLDELESIIRILGKIISTTRK